MKKIILTLLLLVCVFSTSIAQAPQFINYQATFRDQNNQLIISDDISIRISILQFSTSGSPVYTETHDATTTTQGIVNLKIGAGNTVDLFNEIDWSNGPYFLKLEVDTENSDTYSVLGITQLLSVPYALFADKAKSVLDDSVSYWTKNYQNIFYNTGFVGIGSSNPSTKLHIEGDISEGQDRALLRLRNTNVGDKTSVSLALESNDKIYGTAFTQTSSNYAGIPDFDKMGAISTNGKGFSIYSVSDYGSIRFYTNRDENGIIERMRINANGNIGIGTTNPISKLNIVGTVESGAERNLLQLNNKAANALAYSGILLKTGSLNGHSVIQDYGISYTASPNYDFAGFLNISNSNRGVMLHANSADGVIKFFTGHDDFMGAGIERLRIDAQGNVGIGSDNPTAKLEIAAGDVYIKDINKGIIMTSPDGQCWRGTINNTGVLGFVSITCP